MLMANQIVEIWVCMMKNARNKFSKFLNRLYTSFTWKDKLAVTLLIIVHIFYYCLSILLPMLMSFLIDWVIPDYSMKKLLLWSLFSIITYLIYHITNGVLVGYINFAYEINITKEMNMTILNRTLQKPIYVFDKYSDGYLYSLIFQDTTNVVSVSIQMLIRIISISISLMITLIVLWNISTFLFVIELLMMPLVAFSTVAFQPKLEKLQMSQREALDKVTSGIQNILKGKKSIQLSKQDSYFVKQINKYYIPYVSRALKYWRAYFCAKTLPQFIISMSNIILLIGSTMLYIKGEISLGILVLAGTVTSRIVEQVQDILTCYLRRVASHVSFERIDEFSEAVPSPEVFQHESIGQSEIALTNTDIRIDDKLLYHVDSFFSGEKGLIQILGENGSGKSTLLNLLMGVSPSNGLEIKESGDLKIPSNFFANCCYFSSPNVLVEESVRDNILLGRSETDKFQKICKMLKIDFLDKLVTTRPINLSFGEQQKIFLARALCGSESILFLDEPMVNLDVQTKDTLTDYLISQKKDQLIIVISHEDTLTKSCDKIYQIQNNSLVQIK